VDDYFEDLQNLTERLAALGAPMEQDFQVALALRGLPVEYDTLRVAFVTKPVSHITYTVLEGT